MRTYELRYRFLRDDAAPDGRTTVKSETVQVIEAADAAEAVRAAVRFYANRHRELPEWFGPLAFLSVRDFAPAIVDGEGRLSFRHAPPVTALEWKAGLLRGPGTGAATKSGGGVASAARGTRGSTATGSARWRASPTTRATRTTSTSGRGGGTCDLHLPGPATLSELREHRSREVPVRAVRQPRRSAEVGPMRRMRAPRSRDRERGRSRSQLERRDVIHV